jgi:hypothetical protein
MLSKKESAKEFPCTVPTVELLSVNENLTPVLESHSWEVNRCESYGRDGILLSVHCVNCGLKKLSIISDIEESAKRAVEYRKRNSYSQKQNSSPQESET